MIPESLSPPSQSETKDPSPGPVAGPKQGSRESSEFEFVGQSSQGPQAPQSSGPPPQPATLSPPIPPQSKNPEMKPQKPDSGGDQESVPVLFGWMLSKVAEKTKISMESVITTLDPQMKDYIRSGGEGDPCVVVASDKEVKVNSVRQGFQEVMGRATVFGVAAQGSTIAEQPVGFAAGRQAAQERIQFVRSRDSNKNPDEAVVVVAVENFLLEVGDDDWVDVGCLALSDESRKIQLTAYTQPTAVDAKYVNILKDATPESYPKRWSGFARTIGEAIEGCQVATRKDWHQVLGGVSRSELIRKASQSLAHQYRLALNSLKEENV